MQSNAIANFDIIKTQEDMKFIVSNTQTLVAAATPLLAIMISIRSTTNYQKTDELRSKLTHLFKHFETQIITAGYPSRTVLAARYCLSTALDEAVYSTNWGSNSSWAQQSLLATIHKETWGGEKFYIILEKMAQEPKTNIELLQLLYLILSLGFEGMYFNDKTKLNEIKNNIFRIISLNEDEPQLPLISYPLKQKNESSTRHFLPIWIIIAGTTLFYLLTASLSETYISKLLASNTKNIYQVKEAISTWSA